MVRKVWPTGETRDRFRDRQISLARPKEGRNYFRLGKKWSLLFFAQVIFAASTPSTVALEETALPTKRSGFSVALGLVFDPRGKTIYANNTIRARSVSNDITVFVRHVLFYGYQLSVQRLSTDDFQQITGLSCAIPRLIQIAALKRSIEP